ncbi:MAG TPA: hypothetical protein VJ813_18140 [Vicinamibacterales bacterium]|nr:hypothetical protein [Vicinamibacterales bacterium]
MHTQLTRRLSAVFLSAVALSAAPAAQGQRPLAARMIPIDLLCGPQAALAPPNRSIRVAGGGTEGMKALFAPGDTITINAGTAQGVSVGQHYYARRVVEDRFTVRTAERPPLSIHTAGWITVVEVQANESTARVAEACDGIMEGDYLEPLVVPAAAAPPPAGRPDFARPGRVILGDDRRQLGAGGGSLMVMDRGSDHGLRAGQRLTLFRHTPDGPEPIATLGEAVVASTQPETSLIRIETSREAIQVGDLIAIHR